MNELSDTDDGGDGEGVWSPDIEQCFREALLLFPPCGRRKHILQEEGGGKMYGRNELIARHIRMRTGKIRTRKQVSSHIQVLARRKAKADASVNGGASSGPAGSDSPASSVNGPIGVNSENLNLNQHHHHQQQQRINSRPNSTASSNNNNNNHQQNEFFTTGQQQQQQRYYGDIWADRPIVTQKIRLVEFSAFIEYMQQHNQIQQVGSNQHPILVNQACSGLANLASAALAVNSGPQQLLASGETSSSMIKSENHLTHSIASTQHTIDSNIEQQLPVQPLLNIAPTPTTPSYMQQQQQITFDGQQQQQAGQNSSAGLVITANNNNNGQQPLINNHLHQQQLNQLNHHQLNQQQHHNTQQEIGDTNSMLSSTTNLTNATSAAAAAIATTAATAINVDSNHLQENLNNLNNTHHKQHHTNCQAQLQLNSGFKRHSYVKIDYKLPYTRQTNKLETIVLSQIQDKFPEIGGADGLFQRGPSDAFFLVKFWANLNCDHEYNIEDQNSYFGFSCHFETVEPYKVITCSTKACSYGLQVVEKVEKIYCAFNSTNGRYSYEINRSPMCEFMIQFIKKLRQLPRAAQMNSVLENFTVLQEITSESTSEVLLCLAYVFEVASIEQNGNGSQYHVYKLTKD